MVGCVIWECDSCVLIHAYRYVMSFPIPIDYVDELQRGAMLISSPTSYHILSTSLVRDSCVLIHVYRYVMFFPIPVDYVDELQRGAMLISFPTSITYFLLLWLGEEESFC